MGLLMTKLLFFTIFLGIFHNEIWEIKSFISWIFNVHLLINVKSFPKNCRQVAIQFSKVRINNLMQLICIKKIRNFFSIFSFFKNEKCTYGLIMKPHRVFDKCSEVYRGTILFPHPVLYGQAD